MQSSTKRSICGEAIICAKEVTHQTRVRECSKVEERCRRAKKIGVLIRKQDLRAESVKVL